MLHIFWSKYANRVLGYIIETNSIEQIKLVKLTEEKSNCKLFEWIVILLKNMKEICNSILKIFWNILFI